MAKKAPVLHPTVPNISDLLFFEELETPYGTMAVSVNRKTVLSDIERYQQKLMSARGIPMNLDNLNPRDPRFLFVQKIEWLQGKDGKHRQVAHMRNYYETEQSKTQREAAFLTMFAHPQNVLSFDPQPYPPDNILPGMEDDLPPIRRDINHPLERRLKQIIDIVEIPEIYPLVVEMLDRIWTSLEGGSEIERDEDGFHGH